MNIKEPELPEKFSDFLASALNDVEALETNPRYVQNMRLWLFTDMTNETCYYCVAGAVLVRQLKIDDRNKDFFVKSCLDLNRLNLSDKWINALLAIDNTRLGLVNRALRLYRVLHSTEYIEGLNFEPDSDFPLEAMRNVVRALRRLGL